MTDAHTDGNTRSDEATRHPGDEIDPASDSKRTHGPAQEHAREATDPEGDVSSGGGQQPA